MMELRVKVKYFAYIRAVVRDNKEEVIDLERDARLIDLLIKLSEKYGDNFRKAVFDHEDASKLSEDVIILINGRSVDDLETVLKDGDTISIMPFLSGG